MPIDIVKAAMLRSQGMSHVCSMCEKMHEGLALGLDRCTGTPACRGPFGGGDFKEYKGPLTPAMMEETCFVCGQAARLKLKPKFDNSGKVLGICEKHVGLLTELKPATDPTRSGR